MRATRHVGRFALVGLVAWPLASCGGTRSAETGARSAARSEVPTNDQKTAPGATRSGDASASSGATGIENFGHVAPRDERPAISSALRDYTHALVGANGIAACRLLVAPLQAQVASADPRAAEGRYGSCAGTLTSMYAGVAPQTRLAIRDAVIGAIRVEGDQAFALFSQAGAPAAFFPLQRERGRWLVAAIGPTTLPSSRG